MFKIKIEKLISLHSETDSKYLTRRNP